MTTILITDVDNTLYDYVQFFAPPFRAMVKSISSETGVPEDVLYADFKSIFKEIGTFDYQYLIGRLAALRHLPISRLERVIDKGRKAWNWHRDRNLRPYPGIIEALEELRNGGVLIIAVTNAPYYHAFSRLNQINVFNLLDGLVAWEGNYPSELTGLDAIKFERAHQAIRNQSQIFQRITKVQLKPKQDAFEIVFNKFGEKAEYYSLGDSIMKDLQPTRGFGMTTVWAKYGTNLDPKNLETVLRVTPWSNEDIALHGETERYTPDFTINSPKEILEIVPHQKQIGLFDG
jgi:FMN phosphatase YigB (HAD superfamily)